MADELENESPSNQTKPNRRMKNEGKVKEEVVSSDENDEEIDDLEEEDEDEDEPKLGPAALGLQRVGTPNTKNSHNSTQQTQQPPVLNARGMPARIRKKNRLFFDDDIVNTPHHRQSSAKKQRMSTPQSAGKKQRVQTPGKKDLRSKRPSKVKSSASPPPSQSPDRKIGQRIGMRLRNLLKLPKAHKWVCYEWFYSNIDRCLFSGDNDFTICLKESFPELKTRDLTRIEWTKIRRMMGRPRRCSQAFFNQERLDLEKKRNKIRALQQRKVTDMSTFQDLPSDIPMQLVIGTKVTARLRKPQDGLFTGSIDAVDTSNNTYRITFERSGLGTHSVPDYEVLSNEPPETMPINNLQSKARRNGNALKSSSYSTLKYKKDPTIGGSYMPIGDMMLVGGFPMKLLERIILVRKILSVKRVKVKLLKAMNMEAERFNSYDEEIPLDFERRYAAVLIDLEKLNKDLQLFLNEIQTYCSDIAPEPTITAMLTPSHLREKCKAEAIEIVQRNNNFIGAEKVPVTDESILDLITSLTALMLQVKCLSDSDQNAFELQVLERTMDDIKKKLSNENQILFQSNVEAHMKHIQLGLGQANSASGSSNNNNSTNIPK